MKKETCFYTEEQDFKVAVDCIIFGFDGEGLKVLLLKRNFAPCEGEWSLVGGFLRGDETLDQAAERVLRDYTGIERVYMEQLMTFSEVDRDPGGRVLSTAYFALMDIRNYHRQFHNAVWFLLDKMPDLIFDHNLMVKKALGRMRRRASNCPIGFNLLPQEFTLPILQQLYETIFGFEMDKRNFRKKIQGMNILINTGRKDHSNSKKGAFLYSFDEQKYNEMLESGYNPNFFSINYTPRQA
ncbi:MAG: NUDIX domain-containing protein [Odoribacteraceae bacterium]|jgi:ADP-ribose pyrophosphatase YjhB (NUDIX family)|nr:NUDIX domain-containing protein [Odoribacteraceae bacterium]